MTNVLATNAIVPKKIDTPYFLKATKQGFPISGQVPRTYQRYTGTGNQTITYDGSNEITVVGQTLVGPLIITLGPAQMIRNMVGRTVTLNVSAPISQTITLNSSPAFMKINGTGLQQLSHVIPGDNISKSITIYFQSETFINVDYGAASASLGIVPLLPETISLTSSYVHGMSTPFGLPSVYIPDNETYDVTFNELEETYEGHLEPITTSVTGPGTQILSFVFTPAPRRTDSTAITGYLSSGGQYYGSFSMRLNPILRNVLDVGYFTGANSDGTLAMYDPLVTPAFSELANDPNGSIIELGADLLCHTVSLEDSLIFFVRSTSQTIIRFFSIATRVEGVVIDVSSLPIGGWTTGAKIIDLAYDEATDALYALPNGPTSLLCRIPICRYNVNDPTTVRTGTIISRALTITVGSTVFSMAVCPFTGTLYFAFRTAVSNNIIQIYHSFDAMAAGGQFTHPSINTGRTSIAYNPRGQLIAHYEWNNSVYYLPGGNTITPPAFVFAYNTPVFHTSLSHNGYGWLSI